ncbi:RagB/SusD family nutrient uptake outer membrane protein [Pontibacter diazotrophicus]|uniref:RagB/SusD family nutrient uptake outer membrane protein n=1 Tax=Pontibacter diazotrophicus TaxID=1400979 RepID=A0A3D8LID9_9BACT|nr:RagB/SusD family nutrient uptake outer membrane protein [Pontibacter diazotrophicus]RDV17213.1 RagB/SusD family nutrient uptake outer membrane protein [Pontibacter diazotrophicus]
MKITKYPLVIAFGLLVSLTACEIERIPETQISDPSFWRSESDLRNATNYLYTFLPAPTTEDVWSDDAFGTSANNISDGSRQAPSTANDYNDPYKIIRAANNIMEKAPTVPVTEDVYNRYIAEARFFRAWAYVQLFQKYGAVPLILKTLQEDSPELNAPAASRDEVMDAIYSDLDYASTLLPTPTQLGSADYGRVSNTAAMALKARIALFEGTRSKFHNYGEPAKHLTIARDAAKAVIDSQEHSLFGSYFDLFQYAGEGRQNRENILVKQFGISVAEQVANHNFSRIIETGALNGTKSLVDSYLMKDGLPIAQSPAYQAPNASYEVYAGRDERLAATFFKQGDAFISNAGYTVPPLQFHKTGFGTRKYFDRTDWSNQRSFIDRSIIRYAEVLLIYAEATFELQGSISDEDLGLTINSLRQRAGVAELTNSFVAEHGLDMRDEIRRERRVELAMEGFRYWDIMRWKIAENVLVKPVLGMYYFQGEFNTNVAVQLDPEGYLLLQDAEFLSFDPGRDYLWPFPINELGLNPGLSQNPNW